MPGLNLLQPRLKSADYWSTRFWGTCLLLLGVVCLASVGTGLYLKAVTRPLAASLREQEQLRGRVTAAAEENTHLAAALKDTEARLSLLRSFAPRPFASNLETLVAALPPGGRLTFVSLTGESEYRVAGSLSSHTAVADYLANLRRLGLEPLLEFSAREGTGISFSIHGGVRSTAPEGRKTK